VIHRANALQTVQFYTWLLPLPRGGTYDSSEVVLTEPKEENDDH
jgi:hypothetical protein